ncbi:MAG: hypothetical protein WB245_13235 [Acidimicrobiia bacterium]
MPSDPVAVLVTGAYGTGKSSVVEEMAGMLEAVDVSFAMLDLDYLWWFGAAGVGSAGHKEILWANLSAVVGNYRDVGVDHFLVAWAVEDERDLDALRRVMSMPMQVVTLSVPLDVISDRLSSSPATDRQRDLLTAQRWLADGTGQDLDGLLIDNRRPLREVAAEILGLIEWI